mgnify:FL=1
MIQNPRHTDNMKDIATDNLFFINFDNNDTTKSDLFESGNSTFNTSRQPTNSLTIDSFIDKLKNKSIDFKDIKNINFVKPLSKPNGLNYTKEFKEHLDKIKKNQVLKDIYNKNTDSDEDDKQQSFQQMQKEIKEQITTIFNILLTVVSCIVACWYWTPYVSISYRPVSYTHLTLPTKA